MTNRSYTQREIRLALEWAALTYPGASVYSQYRIIVPPAVTIPGMSPEQTINLLKPTNYMVDLVIELADRTLVVEAKTDNESQALGQLALYVQLLNKYPALQEFQVRQLVPVLLFAKVDQEIAELATAAGVTVAVYSPDWIQPFLQNGYRG
jgi:hypothetical protein